MVNGTPGWGGYYLSAYGIAVKHGFSGTEDEWLAFLKANVELRYENGVLEWCNAGVDDWHTLEEFTAFQADLVKKGENARAAAEKANTAAEASRAQTDAASGAENLRAAAEVLRRAAEEERSGAEALRVSGEAERKSAESDRAREEAARKAAESGRAGAEQARTAAETARDQAERARGTAETERLAAEDRRAVAEGLRKAAEQGRETAEAARADAEHTRLEHEAERALSEEARKSAEQMRADGEARRVTAETGRAGAEAERLEAEAARKSGEQAREAAETARAQAEAERAGAERVRENAETARNYWEPYDPQTAYVSGNKVTFNGSSYLNLAACQGLAPTDTAKWRLVAAKGADGEGSGDMLSQVYDPTGKAQDVFAYTDAAAGRADAGIQALKAETVAGLGGKVDKESGKGLSSEDYTAEEKAKLTGIAEGANKTVVDAALSGTSVNPVQNKAVSAALEEKASRAELTTGLRGKVDVVEGKGLSSEDYTAAEKAKLAGIAEGANKTVVDTALSTTSTNPVQNKAAKVGIDVVQTNLNSHTGNKSNPHGVTASQVGAAAASHTHSDKLSLSGGTMTGQLKAQTNTAYGTAQVRNIIISTTDLEPGVSALANGTLYLVYEE